MYTVELIVIARSPVDEGNDDVLDVDLLVQIGAGAQVGRQGLQVKLIREHLWQTSRFHNM